MTDWNHKDIWRKHGHNFLIEVSRHAVDYENPDNDGPNRWAVYAYVYPQHPHFAKFKGNHMWQEAATDMPMHGGPSRLQRHFDDDHAIASYEVGCDYSHLHDSVYTRMETAEDARAVFNDAQELFDWLTARSGFVP